MRRQVACLWVAASVLGWTGAAFAEEPSHIQIKCEPGVQILLDGTLKGITKADLGGLILQNVPAGRHRIKAMKEGFVPQEAEIGLDAGQVLVHEIKSFVPRVQIKEEGEEGRTTVHAKVGTIEIQSLPVECTIDIPSAGLQAYRKTKAKVTLSDVPAGTHAARFTAMGKTLDHAIALKGGATVRLMVNFLEDKVTDQATEAERRSHEDVAGRLQEETAKKLGVTVEKEFDLGDGVKLVMVLIPPGEFDMGSPESENGRQSNERLHRVAMAEVFWIGRYEVTQEQWRTIMGNNPSKFQGDKNPVEMVSWTDCQDFLQKLNATLGKGRFALPTEAQWEYACRAGSKSRFSFGDQDADLPEYAWFSGSSGNQTHPVGQKKPNAWGLHDMHGNLWEWCSDWYGEKYYETSPPTDPTGPPDGQGRVLRGGSRDHGPLNCRSAFRLGDLPAPRYGSGGFRVVWVSSARTP